MSQYIAGTVAVTNGSAAVVGTGTLFAANVAAGDLFTVQGSSVPYEVGSVTDDTHLTLTANYAGADDAAAAYAITTSFTPTLGIPYMEQQDLDTATIFKRAMLLVEALLTGGVAYDQTVNGDLLVAGSLTVNGSVTTVNATNMSVTDSLVKFAAGNGANTIDEGFYAQYQPGGTPLFGGLFRDATDGVWKLFDSLQDEPSTTVNTSGTGYAAAALKIGALTLTGNAAIAGTLEVDGISSLGANAFSVEGTARSAMTNAGAKGTWATHVANSQSVSTSATTIAAGAFSGVGTGTYFVHGKDQAGNNLFFDVVIFSDYGDTTYVWLSRDVYGSPAARTYSVSGSALKLTMASGTYDVNIHGVESNNPD